MNLSGTLIVCGCPVSISESEIWVAGKFVYPYCWGSVFQSFPGSSGGKEFTWNARDLGSIPGLGRSPGEEHGNPLQYSCLENPHGPRSLEGYILRVAKSRTRLSNWDSAAAVIQGHLWSRAPAPSPQPKAWHMEGLGKYFGTLHMQICRWAGVKPSW